MSWQMSCGHLSWQHLSQFQYNGISQQILGQIWPNFDTFFSRLYIFWTPNFVWPQTFLDPNFWTNKFLDLKLLEIVDQNVVGHTICIDQILLAENLLDPNIVWSWTQNFFGPKFFLDPKFFWRLNLFGLKFFWTKIILRPNIFCTQHFKAPKSFWPQNSFGPKFFFDPKFFWTQFFFGPNT